MDSPQPESSPPGQWASGRKLTKSQGERKRAIDRKRVSKRREQNAERIAILEAKLTEVTAELEALKRTKTSDSGAVVSEPNAQCDLQRNTPNTLNDEPWTDTTLGIPPVQSTPIGSILGATNFFQPCVDVNIQVDMPSNSATQSILPNEHSAPQLANEVLSLDPYTEGPPILPSSSSDRSQKSDCQRIFCRSVQKARALTAADVCIDPILNEDALIRGIIHGWGDVKARSAFFCPLWEVLEDLDTRIFLYTGAMTRLPCLKMVHSLLLCLVKASSIKGLPSWYRPRPAQYQFAHPLAADLLPWPALRERAVLSQTLTQTNKFWTELVYAFRFGFPPSCTIHEVATLDQDTDHYSFTGLFLNHVHEIGVWHVDPDFFNNWPETYYDIVPGLEIGRSLALMSGPPGPQEFTWRAGPSARVDGGDKAQAQAQAQRWLRHPHILPLPVLHNQGEDKASNLCDEEEENWGVLSCLGDCPCRCRAPVSQSGFMPTIFI